MDLRNKLTLGDARRAWRRRVARRRALRNKQLIEAARAREREPR
jgi:hypothetical protein